MKRMTIVTVLILLALLFASASYTWRQRQARAADPVAGLTPAQQALSERLQAHVTQLAGTIGERNLWNYEQLQAAARYIEDELSGYGYAVARQGYTVAGKQADNLVVEIAGTRRPEEILLVGAHYDSVSGTPGANDNASGVAALLEIARQLVDSRPKCSVRLVAFVNEEPPLFKSEQMGSLVYARATRQRGERIVAMLCLETLGYYTQLEKSQQFPLPLLRLFYPNTGNFLTFTGNLDSRRLLRQSLDAFRQSSNFPAEGLSAPGWLPGVDWSDHWSFWQIGVPAIMLTDSALYRYHHYHTAQDRPEKLSYPEFARAVEGVIGMVDTLSRSL